MAFDIIGAKNAGYSDTEIADYLSSQNGFDAAGARKAGYSDQEIIGHVSGSVDVGAEEPKPTRIFSTPSKGTQQDVMGIASPKDRQAAETAQTFVKNDIPAVAKTFGAKIGGGMEQSIGGAMRAMGESQGAAYPEVATSREELEAQQAAETQRRANLAQRGTELGNEGRAVIQAAQEDQPVQTRAGRILDQTAQSIGSNLPGMAATMVTGNPAVGLSMMGLQSFGQTYDESRAKGLNIANATMNAAIQGGTEVATEMLPFVALSKYLKTGNLSKEVLKHYLSDIPGEHLATAIQNASDAAYNTADMTPQQRIDAAADYLASGKHKEDQIDTFFTTVLQGAVMGGVAKVARVGNALAPAAQPAPSGPLSRAVGMADTRAVAPVQSIGSLVAERRGMVQQPAVVDQPISEQPAPEVAPAEPVISRASAPVQGIGGLVAERRKLAENQGNPDAQISPVAGLSEPVDTSVSPISQGVAPISPAIGVSNETADEVRQDEYAQGTESNADGEGYGQDEAGLQTVRVGENAAQGETGVASAAQPPATRLPANSIVVQVNDRDGNPLDYITAPHDGTPEGMHTASQQAARKVAQAYPDSSFRETIHLVTDDSGAPTGTINPRFGDISPLPQEQAEAPKVEAPAPVGEEAKYSFVPAQGNEEGAFSDLTDKKTKVEIDDSKSRLSLWIREEMISGREKPIDTTLGKVLDHPDLYKEHPELAGTPIKITIKGGRSEGVAIRKGGIEITVGSSKDLKELLFHEIQHVIQERSGFAKGGSPEVYYPDERDMIARETYQKLRPIQGQEGIPASETYKLAKQYADSTEGGGRDIYKRRAGEEEARRVSARADMSASERIGRPYDRTDIDDPKKIIVDMRGGTIAESSPDINLTLERVQSSFPSLPVTEDNGTFTVTTPSGIPIRISKVGEIEFGPEQRAAAEKEYGRPLRADERPAAEFKPLDHGAVINLTDKGVGELDHEAFHAAMSLALTAKQQQAVLRTFGNEEKAAAEYQRLKESGALETRKGNYWLAKIYRFLRALRQLISPTAKGVMEDVASGKVWGKAHAGDGGARYAAAWHGSPHDFDKFKSSAIGTGEGAQAYGSGLYFSSVRDIADFYRENLSNGNSGGLRLAGVVPPSADKGLSDNLWGAAKNLSELLVPDSKVIQPFSSLNVVEQGRVLSVVKRLLQDDKVLNTVVGFIPVDVVNMFAGKEYTPDYLLHHPTVLVYLLPPNANNLVTTDIKAMNVLAPAVAFAAAKVHTGLTRFDRSPSDFLTASGTLHENLPESVLSKIPYPNEFSKGRLYQVELAPSEDEYLLWDKPLSDQSEKVKEVLANEIEGMRQLYGGKSDPTRMTGAEFYKGLDGTPQEASEYLHSLGVRGIKYLDGTSRGKGDGNHNYVIFSDSDVEIKAKYSLRSAFTTHNPAALKSSLTYHPKVQALVGSVFNNGRNVSPWMRTVGTMYHMAEKLAAEGKPQFKAVFDKGQEFLTDVSTLALKAESLAPDIFPKMGTGKGLFHNLPRKDAIAIAEPLYQGTLFGGADPKKGKVFSDTELKRIFNLSDHQIELYKQARAATDQSLDDMAKSLIARNAKEAQVGFDREMDLADMAAEVKSAIQDKIDTMKTALDQLEDDFKNTPPDPDAKVQKKAEKAHNRAVSTQESAIELHESFIANVENLAYKTDLLKRRGYFPLMRFGQYTVTMKDHNGKVEFFGIYQWAFKARLVTDAMKKANPGMTVTQAVMGKEKFKLFAGMNIEGLQLFAEHMKAEGSEAYQEYLKQAMNNRSAMKRLIHRKGTEGFSEDAVRTLANFITSNARHAATQYHLHDMRKLASDVPEDTQGDVQDQAVKLYEYLSKPAEEASKLRGYLFFHYLGGSLASGIVNMTQPIMMTMPYLASKTTAAKAAKHLSKASKMSFTDPAKVGGELGVALRRAESEGVTAPQEIYQLTAMASNKLFAANPYWNAGMKAWGGFFSVAEAFNRRVTFIASYRISREKGLSPDRAYTEAVKAITETQGIYNKGNRPKWGRGTVGGTLFTFKQFSVMYLELFNRLPAKQKGIMLGILWLMAGLQGMPFAEDAEDIIDTIGQWAGFATNSKRWINQQAEDALGKDAGDFVTQGISSVLPLDLQGRMGLQNLIPGTGILKQSATNKGRDVKEFFGPAGGLLASLGDALTLAAQGLPGRAALAASPRAVQNIAQGVEMMATGAGHDKYGRKTVELSPGESAMKLTGFNPSRVAEEGQIKSANMQDVNLLRVRKNEISTQWAYGIAHKDSGEIAEAKRKLIEWNAKNPELKMNMGGVVQSARQKARALNTTGKDRFLKSMPNEIRRRVIDELG